MSAPDITNGKVPDKSVPWYKADIGTIPPAGASLLQDYSKISPADLDDHIFRVVSLGCRSATLSQSKELKPTSAREGLESRTISLHWFMYIP